MALRLPPNIAAKLIYMLYIPWCRSLRKASFGREAVEDIINAGKPVIFALWHNECFSLIHMRQNLKIMSIASRSRDGEYIARVLQSMGFAVARGSSSKGAVSALLASARLMKKGYNPAITVDGPRGPRHVVKHGVLFLARLTGAHIVPLRAICKRSIKFGSWDRFEIPLPLSRIYIYYGKPYIPNIKKDDRESLEAERQNLENKLLNLGQNQGQI